MSKKQIIRHDIIQLFGEISDHKVVEILDTGANHEELEEAAAWLSGESDVMADARIPLTGRSAQVYDILTRDEEWARETEAEG